MKVAKKALLASTILALSSGAYAMEAMDDQALSDATGQQGLTITAILNISGGTMVYTDCDGYTGTYNKSGDLVINNFGAVGTVTTTIDVGGDGGATAGSKALLNIGIAGTTSMVLSFGNISVISTSADGTNNPNLGGTTAGVLSQVITTTGTQSITINTGYNINVQLGGGASNFAALTGSLGTITIGNANVLTGAYTGPVNAVAIKDVPDGGQIGIAGVKIGNVGLGSTTPTVVGVCDGTTVTATCSAGTPAGIEVILTNDGALANVNMTLANITAGSSGSPSLGSVYISGLNLGNTKINIAGH